MVGLAFTQVGPALSIRWHAGLIIRRSWGGWGVRAGTDQVDDVRAVRTLSALEFRLGRAEGRGSCD